MYISRRQSRVIAVLTLILFFVLGAWFAVYRAGTSSTSTSIELPPTEQTTPTPSPTPISSEKTNLPSAEASLEGPPNDTAEENKPSAARFSLKEFHRSETRDGKLIWEIYGTNARYIPEDNSVAIEDCKLIFFSQEGKQINLKSGTALIFLTGTELSRAELRQDVHLVYDQSITVKTSEADFDKSKNTITSPAFVSISGSWYQFEGTGLHVDLETESLTLKKNVKSSIHPKRRA